MAWTKALFLFLGMLAVILHQVKTTLRYMNQNGTNYERNASDPAFISKCIFDNAKDLVCHYDVTPAARDRDLMFMYSLGDQSLYYCPEQTNVTCTWLSDGNTPIMRHMTHYLFFVENNQVVSNIVVMKPLDELKPGKVRNVMAVPANTTLKVSWSPPQLEIPMVFLYNIKMFHKQTLIYDKNTTEKVVTFKNLSAYEDYDAEVRVRNNSDSGYWSDPSMVKSRTLPGLATANPEVVGYYRLNASHINIMWKPLSEVESRGPNILYDVVINRDGTELRTKNFSMILELDNEGSYVIEVFASRDFERNASVPPAVLKIPFPRKEIISELSPVIWGNLHDVTFYWPPNVNVTNYNLIWCEQGGNNRACKAGFDWGLVEDAKIGKPLALNLSAGVNYNFAIAANYPGEEQGPLTWSTCTYEKGKALKKPKRPFRSHLMKKKELHVEWNMPSCGETGYIANYVVHYCTASDCANTEKTVTVAGTENEWQTSSVSPGYKYDVWIEAKSPEVESMSSERVTVKVDSHALGGGIIAAIVMCVIILLALIAFVVAHFVRTYKKKMQDVAISLPEKEKVFNLDVEDNLTYDYMSQTEQGYRPDSRNSDNSSNARREGFESRTSENLRNEYQEKNLQQGMFRTVC